MYLNEFIRKRIGWCPDSRAAVHRAQAARNSGKQPVVPATRPAGNDRQGSSWDRWYEHTQTGTVQILASVAAIAVILTGGYFIGMYWFLPVAAIVLLASALVFGTLTVSVCDDALRIRFGPVGLIRKSWPARDIASVSPVQNPWYYGWGIRPTPTGTLYTIAGTQGIEVRMLDGKTFRIGTDEPEVLREAIELSRAAAGHLPSGRRGEP